MKGVLQYVPTRDPGGGGGGTQGGGGIGGGEMEWESLCGS